MDAQRIFIVDVEATDKTPYSGVMTEFACVEATTLSWFYARLWPFTPHPDVPALPVVADDALPDPVIATGVGAFRDGHPLTRVADLREVMTALTEWLAPWDGKAVFTSDNPAYDYMWIADAFDRSGLDNPFGHSGRRIGDLAAGLSRNWRRTSDWKSLRRTVHDHHPVNDAVGNAEALTAALLHHRQL